MASSNLDHLSTVVSIVVLLLLFFVVFLSSLHMAKGNKKNSSLTEVQRTQTVTLDGKDRAYTERDIGAKLRCSKTAVHNAIIKSNADGTFHVRKISGHPRKTTLREDR